MPTAVRTCHPYQRRSGLTGREVGIDGGALPPCEGGTKGGGKGGAAHGGRGAPSGVKAGGVCVTEGAPGGVAMGGASFDVGAGGAGASGDVWAKASVVRRVSEAKVVKHARSIMA